MSHQSFCDVHIEEKGEHNYALYGIKQGYGQKLTYSFGIDVQFTLYCATYTTSINDCRQLKVLLVLFYARLLLHRSSKFVSVSKMFCECVQLHTMFVIVCLCDYCFDVIS